MVLSSCAGSGRIHWKCDSPVKSSSEDRASGWRRSDLEKKRIRARIVVSIQIQYGLGRRHTLSKLAVHLPPQDVE